MSRTKLWQISHKKLTANQPLTNTFVGELRRRDLPPKQVVMDLDVPTEQVHNWYYKNIGMTAHDLMSLIRHYDLIRQIGFKG